MDSEAIGDCGWGYTCPNCGAWVPSGVWHTCSQPQVMYHYTYDAGTSVDDRPARALERIADALEKLAKEK